MKKVLVIAMPFSIHTKRWLEAMSNLPIEIHFFSSFEYAKPSFNLQKVTYHDYLDNKSNNLHDSYNPIDTKWGWLADYPLMTKYLGKIKRKAGQKKTYAFYLKKCIDNINPDIVHTLETQHSAYLLHDAISIFKLTKNFEWIHSTWGIDMHYFGDQPEHISKLKKVFSRVDAYCAEGNRDLKLAREFGFTKNEFVFPSVGGYYEINKFEDKPSERNIILVKGYENEVRKGVNVLKGLEILKDILHNYKIIVYSATPKFVEYLEESAIKEITEVKKEMNHREMINLTSIALISITNNLSDGLPNSFIESMACGAFPVQSNTSMANEWIEHGKTGMLVAPNDIEEISNAIQYVLQNKHMINAAAEINRLKFEKAFNKKKIVKDMENLYLES